MAAPKGNKHREMMPGEMKDRHLHIRVRAGQFQIWEDVARSLGMTVSKWVRQTLTRRALEVTRPIDPKFTKSNGNEE